MAERYQIIRPLAQGGFGKTFLASDRYLPTQPLCVIKQLFLENASPQVLKTAQRLFNLEAKTLYQLGTRPQIPALIAHFLGNTYLAFWAAAGRPFGLALGDRSTPIQTLTAQPTNSGSPF